jgi:hypothetical protein
MIGVQLEDGEMVRVFVTSGGRVVPVGSDEDLYITKHIPSNVSLPLILLIPKAPSDHCIRAGHVPSHKKRAHE